ncbi:MAG: zinc ribbon domain-containing protein [Acidobacteriota bacterium]|nr:zinc ribbon domain-containing protein [Acidobacteriota bacterium]
MPLYEYQCHKCGKKFDALQKFSDEPLAVHEECGGELERLVSPPAFHFKGTGWYVTDYAKSNGVSTPASESAKDGKESKAETKSEGKPEAKSESKSETKTDSPSKPAPAPAASTEK